jgi:hypothetical protein
MNEVVVVLFKVISKNVFVGTEENQENLTQDRRCSRWGDSERVLASTSHQAAG